MNINFIKETAEISRNNNHKIQEFVQKNILPIIEKAANEGFTDCNISFGFEEYNLYQVVLDFIIKEMGFMVKQIANPLDNKNFYYCITWYHSINNKNENNNKDDEFGLGLDEWKNPNPN